MNTRYWKLKILYFEYNTLMMDRIVVLHRRWVVYAHSWQSNWILYVQCTLYMCQQNERINPQSEKCNSADDVNKYVNGVKLHLGSCCLDGSKTISYFCNEKKKLWKSEELPSGSTQFAVTPGVFTKMQHENLPSFQRQVVHFCRCATSQFNKLVLRTSVLQGVESAKYFIKECIIQSASQMDRTGNDQTARNFFESLTLAIRSVISDNITYRLLHLLLLLICASRKLFASPDFIVCRDFAKTVMNCNLFNECQTTMTMDDHHLYC